VLLHLAPHVGDETLRRLGEELREPEGRDALQHGGREHARDDGHEQIGAPRAQHIVHEVFRGGGQHQPGQAVHGHEDEADGQQAAPRTDQSPQVR